MRPIRFADGPGLSVFGLMWILYSRMRRSSAMRNITNRIGRSGSLKVGLRRNEKSRRLEASIRDLRHLNLPTSPRRSFEFGSPLYQGYPAACAHGIPRLDYCGCKSLHELQMSANRHLPRIQMETTSSFGGLMNTAPSSLLRLGWTKSTGRRLSLVSTAFLKTDGTWYVLLFTMV